MPLDLRIQVEGIEHFRRLVNEIPEIWDKAVEDVATSLRNLVVGRTPVATGALKRSWSSVEKSEGGFTFGTSKEYSQILEEGLYSRVGARTVEYEGGIYSRQAPGGIIGPLLADEAVLNRVAQQVVEAMARGMDRVT